MVRASSQMTGILDRWVASKLAASKGSKETRRALTDELHAKASELAGPNPTPVERTLAESVALSWFALRYAEAQLTACLGDENLSERQEENLQKRVNHAHRRDLGTLKTLARVRKLAVPNLQINVDRRQVNLLPQRQEENE